jgi:hypothetical protein
MNAPGLVEVLLDKHARWDERDDAAMDLADSDDREALVALLQVGCDVTEADILLESVGESVAEILARHPDWRTAEVERLAPTASRAFRLGPVDPPLKAAECQ